MKRGGAHRPRRPGEGDFAEGLGHGVAMRVQRLIEEREDMLVKGRVVTVALRDEPAREVRDCLPAGSGLADVEAGIVAQFPAEEDFEKGERLIKALRKPCKAEVPELTVYK